MRIKVPHAKNKPALLSHIARTLESMDGVHSADANPVTGSIVLCHEHREPAAHRSFCDRLVEFAERTKLFGMDSCDLSDVQEFAADLRVETEYLQGHSKTARRIIGEVQKVNAGIKKATDNNLDLNVLVPLGVAFVSGASLGLAAPTPLWVTLAIFSFHSFVSLHSTSVKHPQPEQTDTASQPETLPHSVQ